VRHALLAPFPELASIAGPWLEHSIGGRPSHGIPPHVTVLAPSPEDIDHALDGFESFDVTFRETRRFSNAVYLAPDPEEPFIAMTKAVWARFPEWPPYGGEFLPDITPHLTIAWGAKLDEAEAAVASCLPIRARAREVVLFARTESERWVPKTRFPLVDV
jgi:hypothetical protein